MSETGRQRISPAHVALIVVVGALVLLFVVLLVGRLTGGDGRPGDAAATDGQEAGTAAPEGSASSPGGTSPSAGAQYFSSPSGNIVCALTVDATDCVISTFAYEPEDAHGCEEGDAGGHLRVEPAGASMPCEPLVVAGDVPVLEYGAATTAHGYTCESEESGVTCRHDESGHGFTVARASYELF